MIDIGLKIFYNIVYLSVISSLIAIIILSLRKIFDKKISPKWKFIMWLLLLISLLIPYRITIKSQNGHKFIISTIIDYIEKAKDYMILKQYGKTILYIWILGIAVLTSYYIINTIIMERKIGKKQVQDERIIEIFEKAKQKMQIQRDIKLIEQEYKKVPCIYEVFKPKILITKEIIKKDDETLEYIFMHELAHYKRKDIILNKLLIIITILHWFNPILWFCFKQIRQDMELKADELVLEKIQKKQEKQYAKALVSLLPISQEEQPKTRVLCVTDNKKNMERRIKMIKLSDKFKEYKTLIGVTTVILTLCIGMLIFTQIEPKEEQIVNHIQYFETPDRIVYKQKGLDTYYVYTPDEQNYTDLLNQLVVCIDGIGEGEIVSKEEIAQIENEENYIELDYNTISKNYIVAFEKENYNVIKRTDTGGIVVKQSIKNANQLKEMIKEKNNQDDKTYHMSDFVEYISNAEITQSQINGDTNLKSYENNVYSIKIVTYQELEKFIEKYNINPAKEIPASTFERSEIISIISKYDIESVEKRVGGLTFNFTEKNDASAYNVHLYAISKAVNTNCIYRYFLSNTRWRNKC